MNKGKWVVLTLENMEVKQEKWWINEM